MVCRPHAIFMNATMYREPGARRGVYFNPECPYSVLTTVERGVKRKRRASSPQEQGYKYTQVYAW